jgi:branched-chain amino acid transport system ATP-binding protein
MPADTILEITDLHAYYGGAHVLHGVNTAMGAGAMAIVGRNGMGKTTLCRALLGITPPRAQGSIKFQGTELVGKPSYQICRAGIGYVPQGRRLFRSLTTDEHLRMIDRHLVGRGRWTIDAVYDLFPALAERRVVSGVALSGGEQQMLAIGRALLTNPTLMVMDEPSEGLAPNVIDRLVETCHQLVGEGISLLLVEQNLRVATALTDRILIMLSGEIVHETSAAELAADPSAQRQYLGVDRVSTDRRSAIVQPEPEPSSNGE